MSEYGRFRPIRPGDFRFSQDGFFLMTSLVVAAVIESFLLLFYKKEVLSVVPKSSW
jgi:hypothetical protein